VKTKVVISLLANEQEYQLLQGSEAEIAAGRAGLEIETIFAKNNATLQREQLYRFIHGHQSAKPVAIIVQTVAADGLPKVARDAASAGIGWMLLNRDSSYIDELRAAHPNLPIGVVTIDHAAIGRIQGRQLLHLLPRGGSILYVRGPAESSVASQRLQGVREVISGHPFKLEILHGEWTEASGDKAVRSWLRLSTSRDFAVAAIAAQNDAMAVGARNAIAAVVPEWLKRPFLGCDGLVDGGQRLVREQMLAATIIVHPTAGVAVDLLAKHAAGGAPLPARTFLEPKPYPA
jgi:ribose transport system substrate-binding protein